MSNKYLELIPEKEVRTFVKSSSGKDFYSLSVENSLEAFEKVVGGTVHEFHLKGSLNRVVVIVNMEALEAEKGRPSVALQGFKFYGKTAFVRYIGDNYYGSMADRDFINIGRYIDADKKRAENEQKE